MKEKKRFKFLNLVLLVTFVVPILFLQGCHPAALVVPSYIQNVGVELFKNQTSYFGLDTILTQTTIRAFQMDGRLPIEDPEKADLVVKVVIRQYNEQPIFYDPKTNFVLQYQLSVVYDIAAVDQREKKTFMEDVGKTHSVYYYTAQYTGAIIETKDQAIARLADDMSRSIVKRVLEGY